ncbi:hypothetical protein PDJAM_G00194970 [Pangasius djambal]|uniref:Uncharacterized protein n=1 Tax=Pangasius djambal TaxID=1691987 RepID=A0ACC5ZPH3_9TELE|nr:hypothetical protein [Pangasius djambal]
MELCYYLEVVRVVSAPWLKDPFWPFWFLHVTHSPRILSQHSWILKEDLKRTEVSVDESEIFNEYNHAKRIIDGKRFGCWL